MTAYFVLTQDFTDLERFRQEYVSKVFQYIAKHDGEVIVASFDAEALQGDPPKGVVVIRFPSEQAIRDWLNDPDYKRLKETRLGLTAHANAVLAPEFEMP